MRNRRLPHPLRLGVRVVESVAFFLPLMVTIALVAAVALKKLLGGDPILKKKSQMFSEQ